MFKHKRIRNLLLFSAVILFLTGAGSVKGWAQSESPAKNSQELTEKAVLNGCAIAIERIKAGEALIGNLEAEIKATNSIADAWKSKATVLESSIAIKEKEIGALREAVALKDQAVVGLEKALKLASNEAERQKKRGRTKFRVGFLLGFGSGVALRFLF